MRVVAVAGLKGGVGKTTTAAHLAAGLARQGRRVVVVDLDAQRSLTRWLLGAEAPPGTPGTLELVEARKVEPLPLPGREGLELVPATHALAGAEALMLSRPGAEGLLRQGLARLAPGRDHAVLDCPPGMSRVLVAALLASEAVLAPVPPTFMALEGLVELEAALERLRKGIRSRARLAGVLLFGADARTTVTAEVRDALRREHGSLLLRAEVRVSSRATTLPARQALAFDGGDPRGLEDWQAVTRETLARLEGARRGR